MRQVWFTFDLELSDNLFGIFIFDKKGFFKFLLDLTRWRTELECI